MLGTIQQFVGISPRHKSDDDSSWTEAYFHEIGFKCCDNSVLGSTESPDLDGADLLYDDRSFGLGEDLDEWIIFEESEEPIYQDVEGGEDEEKEHPKHGIISKLKAYSIPLGGDTFFTKKSYPEVPKSWTQETKIMTHDSKDTMERNISDEDKEDPNESTHCTFNTTIDSSKREEQETTWKIIKFIFCMSLFLLTLSGFILASAHIQKNDEGSVTVEPPTWAPFNMTVPPVLTEAPTPEPSRRDTREDLIQILSIVSPDSLGAISNETSPQFKAMEWLSEDPNYRAYSFDSVIQRWVLATLYFSTSGDLWKRKRGQVRLSHSTDWLTYSHECKWYSTHYHNTCDKNGKIVTIHLANCGLVGTLPTELGLLSDHLKNLYLPSNSIQGTIPSEFGSMTHMERLQLTQNRIEGSIPSEIGQMTNLVSLGLAWNQFTGNIPSQLSQLDSLASISFEGNQLVGSIPNGFANLTGLQYVALESNQLTGRVPEALGSLPRLSTLSLYRNQLTGAIPVELCPSGESMATLSADCDEIECPCCTECCIRCNENSTGVLLVKPTAQPTGMPTMKPTTNATANHTFGLFTMQPASLPTGMPTIEPSTNATANHTFGVPTMQPHSQNASTTEPTITITKNPSMSPAPTLEPTPWWIQAFELLQSTERPSMIPSDSPSMAPSIAPSGIPSDVPSFAPSIPPSPEPTTKASAAPSLCELQLSTEKHCYIAGLEVITVTIHKCDKEKLDWIGFFKEDDFGEAFHDEVFEDDAELWGRTCGASQDCIVSLEGKVRKGKYRICLVRENEAYLCLEGIIVDNECQRG